MIQVFEQPVDVNKVSLDSFLVFVVLDGSSTSW